jgi:shikimate dehydrogenase
MFGKVKNKNILLLGPGGAGKAVASYFSQSINNKKRFVILARSGKSKNFIKKIGGKWENFKNISKLNFNEIDVVINCTSLGFSSKLNKTPLSHSSISKLNKNAKVFDIIYDPKETLLLKIAKKNKLQTLNGLDMNLFQAVLAFNYVNKKRSKNLLTLKYMR